MSTHTLERYEAELRAQGYSDATIRARAGAPRLVAEHAGVDPEHLTRDDVLAYLGRRRYSRNSRLKYLSWLRQWCGWAGIPDATDGVRRPPVPRGVPKPVSQAGLDAMRAACVSDRERCWLLLGAFAGLRAHESAKVAVEDFEQTAAGAWNLRVLGKGDQLALVSVPGWLVDVVLDAARVAGVDSGRVWPDATSNTVQAAIRRVAGRAGVDCSSHMLRHRYGTAVYESSGRDLLVTQAMMRHASPVQTAGYAQVGAGRAAQVADLLPGGPGQVPGPRLRVIRGGLGVAAGGDVGGDRAEVGRDPSGQDPPDCGEQV